MTSSYCVCNISPITLNFFYIMTSGFFYISIAMPSFYVTPLNKSVMAALGPHGSRCQVQHVAATLDRTRNFYFNTASTISCCHTLGLNMRCHLYCSLHKYVSWRQFFMTFLKMPLCMWKWWYLVSQFSPSAWGSWGSWNLSLQAGQQVHLSSQPSQ